MNHKQRLMNVKQNRMKIQTKNITFNGTFLSVNDKQINIDDFKTSIPEGRYTNTVEKRVYIFEYTYQDIYLKIKFGDGSAMPRNPNVYDVDASKTLPNPRQPSQVEPKETFGLIDFSTGFLWLSNSKKRSSLMDFIQSKFGKCSRFISKDVYDEKLFIETLKNLDDIKISATPNLFSESDILSAKLASEINGYEATTAQIHFRYQNKFVGDNIRNKIKSLFRSRNNFNGIVISGRDEKNLGMLFNSGEFSRKIEFKSEVDENEMFLSDNVFTKLIDTIQDEKK